MIIRQRWPEVVLPRSATVRAICRPGEALQIDLPLRAIARGTESVEPAYASATLRGLAERIVPLGGETTLHVLPNLKAVKRMHKRLNAYALRSIGARQAPRIGNMVMQMLAQRVREADRKIGTLALMDVYGRVASTLLELSVYSNGKLVVGEKLSQQDLANMVGSSREMVNRILKDLSERGFISIESKSITIINRELPPSL